MAHIQLRAGDATANDLPVELVIDGVDITMYTLADGFEIGQMNGPDPGAWYVQVRLAAESLDVDLPDAVVAALRAGEVD